MKNIKINFKNALVLSLLLHIIFLLFKSQTLLNFTDSSSINKNKESTKKEIKFSLIPKTRPVETNLKKQIVNNELTGREERNENAKYLGEKDQTFDRQTVAPKIDIFKEASKGVETGSEVPNKLAKKVSKSKSSSRKLSLNQLGLGAPSDKFNSDKFKNNNFNEKDKGQGSNGGEKIGTRNGSSDIAGTAANNDYLEDVPLGDATNLNTTEFKYYGFYFRIRQRLEQYWGRTLKEKTANLYKSGRKIASDTDMITSLVITLNEKGKIVDVEIKGSSGIKELDEAAVQSFNEAGPFPNPPIGMVVAGKIKIEWGFVVKG